MYGNNAKSYKSTTGIVAGELANNITCSIKSRVKNGAKSTGSVQYHN